MEIGVECSETNVRKLRFGINFQDACISVHLNDLKAVGVVGVIVGVVVGIVLVYHKYSRID